MKHTPSVTAILVAIFIVSQLVGLGLLAIGLEVTVDDEGNTVLEYDETAIGPRPETEGVASFLYILIGVAIGTGVLLVMIKFKQIMMWKMWYFLAVWITIFISLGVVMRKWMAALLALALASWKITRPSVFVYNLAEILVYSGIAVLLVPIFDLFWASMLLILIAIYDAIAVWKSKHMITLAKFQTNTNLFAGLMIPYKRKVKMAKPNTKKATAKATKHSDDNKAAILGGGDIAFPLIFTGTVMQWLVREGFTKLDAYFMSFIIVGTTAASLTYLFMMAKKDHFYPAMPFVSFGAFLGLGIIALIV